MHRLSHSLFIVLCVIFTLTKYQVYVNTYLYENFNNQVTIVSQFSIKRNLGL